MIEVFERKLSYILDENCRFIYSQIYITYIFYRGMTFY